MTEPHSLTSRRPCGLRRAAATCLAGLIAAAIVPVTAVGATSRRSAPPVPVLKLAPL